MPKQVNKSGTSSKGSNIFLILIIISTLLILLFMVNLNRILLNVRIFELKNYLKTINRKDSNIDFIQMVAKYKLAQRRYFNRIDDEEMETKEFRLSETLKRSTDFDSLTQRYNSIYIKPVIFTINGIRLLLDKPPLNTLNTNTSAVIFQLKFVQTSEGQSSNTPSSSQSTTAFGSVGVVSPVIVIFAVVLNPT